LKAFALLRFLVENNGHLLTKDELMEEVWPDAFVGDNNLPQGIAVLRKALGESHQSHANHKYIETVARRGYRFIAHVHIQDIIASCVTESPDETAKPKPDSGEPDGKSTQNAFTIGSRTKLHPESDQAHHLYLRGRHYWAKYTVDGLKKGVEHFRRTIKLEPNYALGYAGLADCYYRLSNIHLMPRKAMPRAKVAVLRALKIDDTLADAYALLGLIRLFMSEIGRQPKMNSRKRFA
jgi:DNA-binding winged helix-turn-helix (wHTH) protein